MEQPNGSVASASREAANADRQASPAPIAADGRPLGTPQAKSEDTQTAKSSGGESAARAIGADACAGITPLEAASRFEAAAVKAGVDEEFAKYVAEPPASTVNSPGYPRLVAAIYASTLPEKQRTEAAAGCAEALASPSTGGQGSSKRAMQEGPSSSGGHEEKGSN